MPISKPKLFSVLSGLAIVGTSAITIGMMSISPDEKIEQSKSSPTIWSALKADSKKFNELKYQLCGMMEWDKTKVRTRCLTDVCYFTLNKPDRFCGYLEKQWQSVTKNKDTGEKINHWQQFLKNVEGISEGIK